MARFQESVDVAVSADKCYQQWLRYDQFPQFMKHVKSITSVGSSKWHWIVDGPLGKQVEWDAVMDGNEPNRIISWHSVGENDIGAEGVVSFQEVANNMTRVTSSIQFEAPAGPIGEMVAAIFANPNTMVREDLANFKSLMESNSFATAAGSRI
jgi:uncharacterized membrane protein